MFTSCPRALRGVGGTEATRGTGPGHGRSSPTTPINSADEHASSVWNVLTGGVHGSKISIRVQARIPLTDQTPDRTPATIRSLQKRSISVCWSAIGYLFNIRDERSIKASYSAPPIGHHGVIELSFIIYLFLFCYAHQHKAAGVKTINKVLFIIIYIIV